MIRTIEIDGVTKTVDVPDDVTDQEMDEIVNGEFNGGGSASALPVEPKKETFFGGIGNDLSKRGSSLMNNASRDESFPEYAVQQVGELAGGANDVLGRVATPVGNAIGSFTKNNLPNIYKAGKATGDAIGRGINKALPDLDRVMSDESNQGETIRGVGNILTLGGLSRLGAPAIKGTGEVVGSGVKKSVNSLGGGIEDFGKTIKAGELKMTNATAKKSYGKDIAEKKQTIINDAANFGVTHGKNEDGAIDAINKAQDRFAKADEIGIALARDPSTPLLNPLEIAMKGINTKIAPTGFRKQAQSKIQDVFDDMALDGHDKPVTFDELIKAKQNLNADGKLFVNGPAGADTDPVGTAIRRKAYLNIVDAIGEISPEIKAMNTEGKRLLDVNAAFSSAASRIANHDAIGLTDFVLGGASIAHPGALAVAAPMFITKKVLGNGRAGNFLINTGRKLQGKSDNSIESTLDKIPKKPDPIKPPPFEPITDKKRMIGGWSINDKQKIEPLIPTKGERMKSLGESGAPEFDKPSAGSKGRLNLPSPEEIKKLYPHLSEEDIKKVIYQLDDNKSLPAPMIDNQNALQKFERQFPTLGQRLGAIGELKGKKLKDVPFTLLKTRKGSKK